MRLLLANDLQADDMCIEIYDGDELVANVSENTGEIEIYPESNNQSLRFQLVDLLDALQRAQSVLEQRASPSGRKSIFDNPPS
jgi:hypothetical protein